MKVENCIVAILPEHGTVAVGAGSLVTRNHILTCAHVVNTAVGRNPYSLGPPAQKVTIIFLSDSGATPLSASIRSPEHWRPPIQDRPVASTDMAILTLEGTAPQTAVEAPIRERYPLKGSPYSVLGFPDKWDFGQGQIGSIGEINLSGRYALLKGDDTRPPLRPGFSGSPVIQESAINRGTFGILGMVVAARQDAGETTAYMIPAEQLKDFLASLENVDIRNGVVDDFPHIREIEKYLRTNVVKKAAKGQQSFDLRAMRCSDVESVAQLFRKDPEATYGPAALSAEQLLDDPEMHRLLLQSPGGAGKSNFLAEVVESAIAKGMAPFLLDATNSHANVDAITDLKALFYNFRVEGGIEEFVSARKEIGKDRVVLIVDRLNENPEQAGSILKSVIRAAESEASGAVVIIADRVKDRGEISQFEHATVLPLPLDEIEKHLGYRPAGANAKLLATPFFLAMQIESNLHTAAQSHRTRSEMFREFFRIHVYKDRFSDDAGLEEAINSLAESAFNAYKKCRKTVIPEPEWRAMLKGTEEQKSEIITGAMLEYAGAKKPEKVVEFRHQLLHDFLAGTHLAKQGEAFWRSPNFDIVSLENQSYDGIEFAAEQLGELATRFLIQVYDWNWMGVLESVRNLDAGRHGGGSPVSAEFKDALYLLNAMRLFDCFQDSRKRTELTMADVHTATGLEPGSIHDFGRLRQIVKESYTPKDPYFEKWKDLFLRDDKLPVSVQDLDILWSDPFRSWTATSIFRRLPRAKESLGSLQMFYEAVRNTGGDRPEAVGARWRFVHLMGVAEDAGVREFLWSVIINPQEHKNVRSGAMRSYIENATLVDSGDVRGALLAGVAEWVRTTDNFPNSMARQLRTCAQLAEDCVRDHWDEDYKGILEAGVRRAAEKNDADEKQAWERRIDEIGKPAAGVHP